MAGASHQKCPTSNTQFYHVDSIAINVDYGGWRMFTATTAFRMAIGVTALDCICALFKNFTC